MELYSIHHLNNGELFCLLFLYTSAGLSLVVCQNWAIHELIPLDYDKHQVPLLNQPSNESFSLNASIKFNDFFVLPESQSLRTDLTLCLNWTDYRIQSLLFIDSVRLTNFKRLWLPAVFFRNALQSNTVNTLRNVEYVQIWPGHKLVKYCTRMAVTFLCRIKLTNFPFDEHFCQLELESFAQRLKINMHQMEAVEGNTQFRVRDTFTGQCSQISVAQYQFQQMAQPKLTNFTSIAPNCVFAGVHLVRNVNYYVIRYYCPTFFIVMISFCGFWLPSNAFPARITLTAQVQLALFTTSRRAYSDVNQDGVVSLYWWLWGCQFFVYMCLSEFVMALTWARAINDMKAGRAKAGDKTFIDRHFYGKFKVFNHNWSNCGTAIDRIIHLFFGPVDHYREPENRNKVDYLARIVYPILLLIFTFVYILSTVPCWANKWRW